MRTIRFGTLVFSFALIFADPAVASEPLELEPGAEWVHPHSGISVPANIGGVARSRGTTFAPDLLDVGLQFDSEDGTEAISFFVFRATNGDAAVWFAQAQEGIESRDIYANPVLASGPEAFAHPGMANVQGLKAVYQAGEGSDFSSTGLAVFAIDGWYVKLRASSGTRSPLELGEWMVQALSQIGMPQRSGAAKAVMPVVDCPVPLVFAKQAKDAKSDGAANLLGGLLGSMIAQKMLEDEGGEAPDQPVSWCRDSSLGQNQNVYRANESENSYLIAAGDNGVAVQVAPDAAMALLAPERAKKAERFAITLLTAGENVNYVPQNRLPSPQRVWEIINVDRRVSSVATWGDDSSIKLNADAM